MVTTAIEDVGERAKAMEALVVSVLKGEVKPEDFLAKARGYGANSTECTEYASLLKARFETEPPPETETDTEPVREKTPSKEDKPELYVGDGGLLDNWKKQRDHDYQQAKAKYYEHRAAQNASRIDTIEEVTFAVLQAQLEMVRRPTGSQVITGTGAGLGGKVEELLLKAFANKSADSDLPDEVLAVLPELAEPPGANITSDPILYASWNVRKVFKTEAIIDKAIDRYITFQIKEPLTRVTWKDIILQRYVPFDKLYATLQPGFDHRAEPRDFGAGYAIVKKESYTASKPVLTESEWLRIFDAYMEGVCTVYKHRRPELEAYRDIVIRDGFRTAPRTPRLAISFDAEARQLHARAPYRLDNPELTRGPMWRQMVEMVTSLGQKRSWDADGEGGVRHGEQVCWNWNEGRCSEPCYNRRRHVCSVCREGHRSIDNESCKAAAEARKRKRTMEGTGGGSGSFKRT